MRFWRHRRRDRRPARAGGRRRYLRSACVCKLPSCRQSVPSKRARGSEMAACLEARVPARARGVTRPPSGANGASGRVGLRPSTPTTPTTAGTSRRAKNEPQRLSGGGWRWCREAAPISLGRIVRLAPIWSKHHCRRRRRRIGCGRMGRRVQTHADRGGRRESGGGRAAYWRSTKRCRRRRRPWH